MSEIELIRWIEGELSAARASIERGNVVSARATLQDVAEGITATVGTARPVGV